MSAALDARVARLDEHAVDCSWCRLADMDVDLLCPIGQSLAWQAAEQALADGWGPDWRGELDGLIETAVDDVEGRYDGRDGA